MDTTAIVGVCLGSLVMAGVAFAAHRRLAGSGERPGFISMIAFVIAWLAGLTAVITGLFLIAGR